MFYYLAGFFQGFGIGIGYWDKMARMTVFPVLLISVWVNCFALQEPFVPANYYYVVHFT